jgi:hypothetical protein
MSVYGIEASPPIDPRMFPKLRQGMLIPHNNWVHEKPFRSAIFSFAPQVIA